MFCSSEFSLELVARTIAWVLVVSPFVGLGFAAGSSLWTRSWPWRRPPP